MKRRKRKAIQPADARRKLNVQRLIYVQFTSCVYEVSDTESDDQSSDDEGDVDDSFTDSDNEDSDDADRECSHIT